MRFWARVGLFFYMFTIILLSFGIAVFVFNFVPFQDVIDVLWIIYNEQEFRILFGGLAALMLIKNHFYSRAISGAYQKQKTIAFDNPSGRVSVSLEALEDLIRRVVARVPEVKEARPFIVATGKGLDISVRLVLNSEANIPDLTARLQDLIKRKVQDTIGIDEDVVVKIDVIKIIPEDRSNDKRGKKNKEDQNLDEPTVPFQGYRA